MPRCSVGVHHLARDALRFRFIGSAGAVAASLNPSASKQSLNGEIPALAQRNGRLRRHRLGRSGIVADTRAAGVIFQLRLPMFPDGEPASDIA